MCLLFQEDVRPTTELVQSLIDTHTTLDVKIAKSKMSLFKDSATLDSIGFDKQNRWNISQKRFNNQISKYREICVPCKQNLFHVVDQEKAYKHL